MKNVLSLFMPVSAAVLLTILMMAGSAQPTLAQQRRTIGKKTTPVKRTVQTQPVINVNFEGELGLFQLRGPVKSFRLITNDFEEQAIRKDFDRNGFQTDWDGKLLADDEVNFKYTRDDKGRIIVIDAFGFLYLEKYEYNSNGLPIKKHFTNDDGSNKSDTRYSYNSEGELISEHTTYFQLGRHGRNTVKYVIVSRDNYGNWTERESERGNEKRIITYYE